MIFALALIPLFLFRLLHRIRTEIRTQFENRRGILAIIYFRLFSLIILKNYQMQNCHTSFFFFVSYVL